MARRAPPDSAGYPPLAPRHGYRRRMKGDGWLFLYRGVMAGAGAIILIALMMAGIVLLRDRTQPLPHLSQVKRAGKLRVLTLAGATTYYPAAKGHAGMEYSLVTRFADRLGVEAEFIVARSLPDLLSRILAGEADLAAASLSITDARRQYLRFSNPYQTVTEQLVYHGRQRRPRSIDDLSSGLLEITIGSSYVRTLENLRLRHPDLNWNANPTTDTETLLHWLNIGLIDYTVLDSHLFDTLRRFYPRLHAAFNLGEARSLGWAFSKRHDGTLLQAANAFFQTIRQDGTLAQLLERYYGHVGALNYAAVCAFRKAYKMRLPRYREAFEEAARRHGWDWRLLAAIAYQESHWKVNARSPTGVRGLMMLTRRTARRVRVDDRNNPRQSILGGTRYLVRVKDKIPRRISEPDRTWLALAAYNIGFGHLEDARILTQSAGKNPDRWMDVKKYLPMLTEESWYRRVEHGYARGHEPVRYVERIRNYYDLLRWLSDKEGFGHESPAPAPRLEEVDPKTAQAVSPTLIPAPF
ncbi:MAG: membrane-bound lytic murein transglycosylase MltF [Methylothermaceae bacterium]|nr:membrane-bound lytic murein transglycosylase MltF [Methylothermaceae bacterium]